MAGVFTQNQLPAAPVLVSREHLRRSGGALRALVVSSGNANACTGEQGLADAREMASRVAARLGCPPHEVLVASTGVIGRPLPMDRVRAGIDGAFEALGADGAAAHAFLAAIQTTDAFPKEAGEAVRFAGGPAGFAGVCKGAGMIHPDMATMLAFAGTDCPLDPAAVASLQRAVLPASFNALHVDTHASTNDTFLLFSTGRGASASTPEDAVALRDAALRVCQRLAWLIARDGEGATKVTRIHVRGAATDAAARAIADRVAASALVRTALFGNDPNWGRFVSAVGNAREVVGIGALRCSVQGICVYEGGRPLPVDLAAVAEAMQREDVTLDLELADGPGQALVMTSDLGYRYVEINAEYTT